MEQAHYSWQEVYSLMGCPDDSDEDGEEDGSGG